MSFIEDVLCILFIITVVGLLIVTLLTFESQDPQAANESLPDSSFTRISQGSRMSIFRENNTDVLYVSYHAGFKGGLTVMLNADGNPLTYQEWLSSEFNRDLESLSQHYESLIDSQ